MEADLSDVVDPISSTDIDVTVTVAESTADDVFVDGLNFEEEARQSTLRHRGSYHCCHAADAYEPAGCRVAGYAASASPALADADRIRRSASHFELDRRWMASTTTGGNIDRSVRRFPRVYDQLRRDRDQRRPADCVQPDRMPSGRPASWPRLTADEWRQYSVAPSDADCGAMTEAGMTQSRRGQFSLRPRLDCEHVTSTCPHRCCREQLHQHNAGRTQARRSHHSDTVSSSVPADIPASSSLGSPAAIHRRQAWESCAIPGWDWTIHARSHGVHDGGPPRQSPVAGSFRRLRCQCRCRRRCVMFLTSVKFATVVTLILGVVGIAAGVAVTANHPDDALGYILIGIGIAFILLLVIFFKCWSDDREPLHYCIGFEAYTANAGRAENSMASAADPGNRHQQASDTLASVLHRRFMSPPPSYDEAMRNLQQQQQQQRQHHQHHQPHHHPAQQHHRQATPEQHDPDDPPRRENHTTTTTRVDHGVDDATGSRAGLTRVPTPPPSYHSHIEAVLGRAAAAAVRRSLGRSGTRTASCQRGSADLASPAIGAGINRRHSAAALTTLTSPDAQDGRSNDGDGNALSSGARGVSIASTNVAHREPATPTVSWFVGSCHDEEDVDGNQPDSTVNLSSFGAPSGNRRS